MYQNLSSYRIFYTVANTKNISKAAKELYISQPAISKSIQKLEESLGTKLFERSSRGVALTDSGELLYTHVKSAFETLSIGEDRLRRSIELGIGHLTRQVAPFDRIRCRSSADWSELHALQTYAPSLSERIYQGESAH